MLEVLDVEECDEEDIWQDGIVGEDVDGSGHDSVCFRWKLGVLVLSTKLETLRDRRNQGNHDDDSIHTY